jgi:hypothetical protein
MSRVRLAIIAVVTAVTAGPCWAQQTAVQPGAAFGTIFQPITLQKTSDLEFGSVVRPAAGSGVVTVDPATGARSLSGQGALLNSGTPVTRAAFIVGGEGGQAFNIAAPAAMTLTRAGGAETISVSLTPTVTSGVLSGALGSAGTSSFGVGGAMTVSPAVTSGAYAGNFQVVVAYN